MRNANGAWIVLGLFLLPVQAALAENYAILFSGGIDPSKNYPYYYTNTLRMYNLTVGNLSFLPQNVWVLAADGLDPNVDRAEDNKNSDWSTPVNKGSTVLAARPDNLHSVIQGLKLGPADMLYFWSFDHGGGFAGWDSRNVTNEETLCGWHGDIDDDVLGGWLGTVNAGRQAYVFTQCYSGGLVDDLLADSPCPRLFAAAATNHYEESYWDSFAKAFADGMDSGKLTLTYDLYQHAYENDPNATNGEGPGGVYYPGVEHPWKTGENLDLAAARWVGNQTGGSDGQRWSNAANWDNQPDANRTVQVTFDSANRFCWIDGDRQAGYLTADWNASIGADSAVTLDAGHAMHSRQQVIGDKGYGRFTQYDGRNDVSETLWIANAAGSGGRYDIAAGTLTADRIIVGNEGTGQFQHTGGTVDANSLALGNLAGSSGSYAMGKGCTLTIGDETVGGAGGGSFTQSGGDHTVANCLALGGGSFTLAGGTLTTGSVELQDSSAAFMQSGGSHVVKGTMTVNGGTYQAGGGLVTADKIVVKGGGLLRINGAQVSILVLQLTDDATTFTLDDGKCGVSGMELGPGATFNYNGGMMVVRDAFTQEAGSTFNGVTAYNNDANYIYYGGTLNGRFYNNHGTVTLHADFAPTGGLTNLGTMDITGGNVDVSGNSMANYGTMTQYSDLTAGDEGVGNTADAPAKYTLRNAHNTISNRLIVGNQTGATELEGTYRMEGVYPSIGGAIPYLSAGSEIRVGANGGKGRFEWIDGAIDTPTFTLGAKGTLVIGFDFDIQDLRDGKIFASGNTNVVGLDVGTVEVLAKATLNGGLIGLRGLQIGGGTGGGEFVQTGGTNNAGYVEVSAGGRYEYSGGSLAISDGGLHVAGELDMADQHVTLTVGNNALVNLTAATISNAYNGSLMITGTDCLTILPPGFDTHQFGAYVNNGRAHVAGSILGIDPPESYTFQGYLDDHVQCQGHLAATPGGYIHVDSGLEVDGAGYVDLGEGTLTVNDAISHLGPTGSIAARQVQVGAGGSGAFTQLGGTMEARVMLTIGRDVGDVGQYDLSAGALVAGVLNVGCQGRGTLRILDPGASVTVTTKLHLGPDSALQAAAGVAIHMTGAAFENESTKPADLAGLENLTMVFEGGAAAVDPFEVAGAHDGGFVGNFVLGEMILGADDVGKLRLVDEFDNGRRTSGFPECLFLHQLTINPGSSLDLNGLYLYVTGDAVDLLQGYIQDGSIYDSMYRPLAVTYDASNGWTSVPEPAVLSLLGLGFLTVLVRRRKLTW